ncbi:oxidoreductase [Microthyrium microscopicum]|uniref:Oxidoreductase n=1 Tax=Microthyrium microscopicum TaxID=703497 RepID=A0A6A6U1X0_9PEZI|nr:oxidoreductase [Microthyrium microscopicum]
MPQSILIIGNSIAGPTLATFLLLSSLPASEKPHITILERAPNIRVHGQNIDIRGAGLTLLQKLGLEAVVRASTTGEAGVRIVDDQDRTWAAFPAGPGGSGPTSDVEILRGRLAEILYERSRTVSEEVKGEGGHGIEYLWGDFLTDIEQNGEMVDVVFAKSGAKRSFDLVVGADGLQSRTRRLVWGDYGESERVRKLGMYGAFFSMPVGKTDSMWRRWYHAAGRRWIMIRPDEQRGLTTVFMATISDDKRWAEAALKSRAGLDGQKALMKECFQDAGWESERVLKEMESTEDFYYDMIAQVKMDKWSKGRVVLLGDSAFCASPISGMGTTLAMTGAYNLAGALTQHPDDPEAAFSQYEKAQRPIVNSAQKLAPGFPHLITPQTPWGVWILHAIMWIIYRSRLIDLLSKIAGPPAGLAPINDYGFKQLSDISS